MTAAPATLHNGVTAVPVPVEAQLSPSALRIVRADGATETWPVGALREIDKMPWELRIARAGAPQRLVVRDPDMMAALDTALTPWRIDEKARRRRRAFRTALFVPLLGALLWFGWPPLADAIARTVPMSWEQRIGDSVVATMTNGRRRCEAPDGVAALNRLSARLAETAGLSARPSLVVLDSGLVNAFATPGRHVVIHRGLIDQAGSPEEVAGVLAHEFGHIRHRHGLRHVARAVGVGTFVSVLIGGSDLGAVAATLVVTLSYSRDFEAQADADAADVLTRSGIGVEGLARFFERVAGPARREPSLRAYFTTHPDPAERAAGLRARGGEATAKAMTPEEWQALRMICRPAAS